MLVFLKQNLVIFSVPKTGTSALISTLAPRAGMVLRDPPALKHTNFVRYRRFLQPYLEKLGPAPETMAIVREPIDRLGSWYRYRSRDELVGHAHSTRGITFDAFVLEYLKDKPAKFADLGGQFKFLSTAAKTIEVTHLFRYEAQPTLLGFLETRLHTKISLPQVNVSPPADTSLSPDVESALRAKMPEEFALWEGAMH